MNNIDIDTQLKNNLEQQEPYVGMPVSKLNMNFNLYENCDCVDRCPLAMAYVPMQRWYNTYEPAVALQRGTIFPELDLPFLGGGAC